MVPVGLADQCVVRPAPAIAGQVGPERRRLLDGIAHRRPEPVEMYLLAGLDDRDAVQQMTAFWTGLARHHWRRPYDALVGQPDGRHTFYSWEAALVPSHPPPAGQQTGIGPANPNAERPGTGTARAAPIDPAALYQAQGAQAAHPQHGS